MRTFNKILLFVLGIIIISCKKDTTDLPAGCDVNGLWIGTWQSPGNTNGTFFAPVVQNNSAVNGNVYIRFDLPSLENIGVKFSANVHDKNVNSIIDFEEAAVKITGSVGNDSLVSGNFTISTGGGGTFNGTKIQTITPVLKEIYSSHNGLTGLICIGQRLWVWTSNGTYNGWDDYKYVVKRINYDGSFIDSLLLPCSGSIMGNRISFDGEKIWQIDVGVNRIYVFDTLGNRLDTFNSPAYYADAIACINNQVYITDGYNRVTHILNSNAQELSTFPNEYISIGALCEFQQHLLMSTTFYNTLLKTDMNGKIEKAYTLPEQIVSICTNGETVWCLTQEYISSQTPGPGTSIYKIYEVQIN